VITVNGQPDPEAAGGTVAELLERLGLGAGARGVAVAVDGEIVPRLSWERYELSAGARVEVLSAMQGG
jgi:sulfur carrier protein